MEPAAPTVDRATLLIDTVKRDAFVRQVRGLGTLVRGGRLYWSWVGALVVVVALVVVSLEVLLLRTYLQMAETAAAHERSALVPLNLANVQREALGLHVELSRASHHEGVDAEPVRVREALLLLHVSVAKASAAYDPETVRLLDGVAARVQRALVAAEERHHDDQRDAELR